MKPLSSVFSFVYVILHSFLKDDSPNHIISDLSKQDLPHLFNFPLKMPPIILIDFIFRELPGSQEKCNRKLREFLLTPTLLICPLQTSHTRRGTFILLGEPAVAHKYPPSPGLC